MTTIAEAAPSRAGALRAGDDERPHSLGLLGVAGLLWRPPPRGGGAPPPPFSGWRLPH
jgi:hypothetical protein